MKRILEEPPEVNWIALNNAELTDKVIVHQTEEKQEFSYLSYVPGSGWCFRDYHSNARCTGCYQTPVDIVGLLVRSCLGYMYQFDSFSEASNWISSGGHPYHGNPRINYP